MLFSLTISIALLWTSALSAPPPRCVTKLQRRAWHTFSNEEKKAYLDADVCLMKKPATLGLPGAKNRLEELQASHRIQASIIHGVGAFLPYHRLLVHAHERALREECGFQGAQPYWDEPRDAGKFSKSDVLDPVTGFGGNGRGGKGCIADGPFGNYSNNIGPGYSTGQHCIYRFVNDTCSIMSGQIYVDVCSKMETFAEFWPCIETAPHGGGHGGVGGKMWDGISSPGDPVFYLHHTWLDKLFWEWQARNLPARLRDISGRNVPAEFVGLPSHDSAGLPLFYPNADQFPPAETLHPPPDAPGPEGDPGNTTTLAHVLNMFGVVPNATIQDVMDITGPLLCYEYV